jgi:hypothetical protein
MLRRKHPRQNRPTLPALGFGDQNFIAGRPAVFQDANLALREYAPFGVNVIATVKDLAGHWHQGRPSPDLLG